MLPTHRHRPPATNHADWMVEEAEQMAPFYARSRQANPLFRNRLDPLHLSSNVAITNKVTRRRQPQARRRTQGATQSRAIFCQPGPSSSHVADCIAAQPVSLSSLSLAALLLEKWLA